MVSTLCVGIYICDRVSLRLGSRLSSSLFLVSSKIRYLLRRGGGLPTYPRIYPWHSFTLDLSHISAHTQHRLHFAREM